MSLYSKYILSIIITQITGNPKVPDLYHEHLILLYNLQAATLIHLYIVWKVKKNDIGHLLAQDIHTDEPKWNIVCVSTSSVGISLPPRNLFQENPFTFKYLIKVAGSFALCCLMTCIFLFESWFISWKLIQSPMYDLTWRRITHKPMKRRTSRWLNFLNFWSSFSPIKHLSRTSWWFPVRFPQNRFHFSIWTASGYLSVERFPYKRLNWR